MGSINSNTVGTVSATSTLSGSFSGAFAVAQNKTITLKKIGDTVTMSCTFAEAAAAAGGMTYSLAVTAGFRPALATQIPIVVTNNSVRSVGIIDIATDGSIVIYKDATPASFDGTGNNGFRGFAVTWTV